MSERRIPPQPVTLSIVPVELHAPPETRDALLASNGVDLLARRMRRIAAVLAPVALLFMLARMLLGCSPATLAAIGAGASTARDVAKAGCAILESTDGTSADVLAATTAMQRAILEAQADAAKQRGADAATIDALVKSIAVLSEALKANAAQVVTAAGNGPAKLTPCPAASATTSATAAPTVLTP